MRPILSAIVLGAVLALSGCASSRAPIGVDKTAPAPVQAAQAALAEGWILVAAVSDVVARQKRDGVITAAERDIYTAKLDEQVAALEKAEDLIATNAPLAASRASATKALLLLLQREIASKARSQK